MLYIFLLTNVLLTIKFVWGMVNRLISTLKKCHRITYLKSMYRLATAKTNTMALRINLNFSYSSLYLNLKKKQRISRNVSVYQAFSNDVCRVYGLVCGQSRPLHLNRIFLIDIWVLCTKHSRPCSNCTRSKLSRSMRVFIILFGHCDSSYIIPIFLSKWHSMGYKNYHIIVCVWSFK